jgi:hypothetical protein
MQKENEALMKFFRNFKMIKIILGRNLCFKGKLRRTLRAVFLNSSYLTASDPLHEGRIK